MIYLVDEFPEHPKVVRAGGDAAWLWVCGMGYVNRQLTRGFIPADLVPRLSDRKAPMKLAERLVDVGLWEKVHGGFLVHDYDDHNFGALAKKQARQDKARKAANARWTRDRQGELELNPDAPSNARSIAPSNAQAMRKQCLPMPPTRATTTHSPQPTPLEVDRSLSSSPPEPSIDDDAESSPGFESIDRACRIVASARLTRRIGEKGPVGDPDAWANEAARRAFNAVSAAAEILGPDADADDLAQWVLIREQAPQEARR